MASRHIGAAALSAGMAVVLAACSSGTSKPVTLNPATTIAAPSHARIASWPSAWCSVPAGATIQQLEDAMGPPTQDDSTNPTDPTLTWQAFDYQFIAFLGLDGKAMTLDANDIMLTPSEKSQITCPEVRRAS